jgi:hypothetical protein
MIACTIPSQSGWLSCDHTFHSAANIGLFRDADGHWVEQYEGLFCILNSDGEVLTWKLTKSLRFECIKEQVVMLKERLLQHGKTVEEFYIDNCCTWRLKLQEVFGSELRVMLDIFHAVQRIAKKIPKRHPFHYQCVSDLKLSFRDPTDKGPIRTKSTPDCTTLKESLIAFQRKWESISYDGVKVLPVSAIREINCILRHVDRGCLSNILPGRGTNRNERLHRELNKVLSSSRYGVELGYALLSCFFFNHNEKLRALKEDRVVKPIFALTHSPQEPLPVEKFGLTTLAAIPMQERVCPVITHEDQLPLLEFDYNVIKSKITLLMQSICEDDNAYDNQQSVLTNAQSVSILQQTITHYYVSQHMSKLSKTASFDTSNCIFASTLAIFQHFCNFQGTGTDIDSVLSTWNFERVPVPADGNCLFTAVALALVERVQNEDKAVMDILQKLGVPINECNVTRISQLLRSLVVQEWQGDNGDYYQSFTTSDIQSEAQQYFNSGEFAGNLGDLMVVTLSNVLHMPISIFTTIPNLSVLCITPGPITQAETIIPLYLTYNHIGPGHYDYAIPMTSSSGNKKETSPKYCFCGRKEGFRGVPCSTDMLGHCRCPCAKRSMPCQSSCKCKGCLNAHGVRPSPSTTRRREKYDTQRQPLCGRKGSDFLQAANEQESIGHTTVFERLLVMAIVVFFMQSGIDIDTKAERVYQAYCEVIGVSKMCTFVELPLFKRNQQYLARYLQKISKLISMLTAVMAALGRQTDESDDTGNNNDNY